MDQDTCLSFDSNSEWVRTKRALNDFNQAHGTPGVMPTSTELGRVGRRYLDQTIRKLGGYAVVAAQFGFTTGYMRKPGNYWNDFSRVETEIQEFIQEHGTIGIMPIKAELHKAGRGDLAKAIVKRHGGIEVVAERLGLRLSHAQHPDGYWDDFVNVERELLAFVSEYGTPGVMPSRNDLRQAGLNDLNGALKKHGGTSAVAKRLNLKPKFKPMGYWDNFANVERTLSAYIAEHGTPGVMPSLSELQRSKQSGLVNAINKHGGIYAVAERLGLQLSSAAKPPSYWDNIEHIMLAICEFNEVRGTPGVMSTGGELKKAGRTNLASAITNHGGFPALAERFGLLYTYTAKPDRCWEDFANVQQEILDFNQAHGISGRMPTTIELRDAGKHSLTVAISAHGGFPAVAKRLEFVAKTKPNGYWDDFANVERELLAFIQEQGTFGVMPTGNALKDAGRSNLAFAIHKHGGM